MHDYVIEPVTSMAKVVVSKTPGKDFDAPKFLIRMEFDLFALTFTRKQYEDLILLVDLLSRLNVSRRYLCYRPKCTVREDPRKWWDFVLNCVRHDIRVKQNVWTWSFLKKRRDVRVAYMETYRKLLLTPRNMLR